MRYPAILSISISISSALVAGCGDEVSVSFGSLSGSYEVAEDCFIHVSGSQGQASCNWSEEGFESEGTRTGTLNLTLAEGRITMSMSGSKRDRWCYDGDCEPWTECVYTISGSATKQSGRQDSGMLAPVAGVWTGSAVIQKHCEYGYDGTQADETRTATFSADIFGSVATIDYGGIITPRPEWGDDDFSDRFSVVATGTSLTVDGYSVRKL